MKHFFDAVADNVALQEEFEHTLPRTRDQVKEQLIMPIDQANRSGQSIRRESKAYTLCHSQRKQLSSRGARPLARRYQAHLSDRRVRADCTL